MTAVVVMTLSQLSGFVLPAAVSDIAAVLITLILLFVYARLRGTGAAEYGLQRPESWTRTILWGLLYAFVTFCLFRITLEPLLERFTGVPRDMSHFASLTHNLPRLIKILVIMWIMAAFFEEIFFRGFLIPSLSALMNPSKAAVVCAVALSAGYFALQHSYQGITGILYTGLAAVFLSAIYLGHGRNLWIPIIAHGLHDTSGMFFIFLGIYNRVVHLLF